MVIGILSLQGAVKEHIDILKKCRVDTGEIKNVNQLENIDGLIIPGGESTAISCLMTKYGFVEKLKEIARGGMPILGTCTGLILLSKEILDGERGQKTLELMDITTQRNAFGRQTESFEAPLNINILGKAPFPGVFIRAPIITRAGNEVEILAEFEGKIVGVRQRNLVGISFHPELTQDTRFHNFFIDIVRGSVKIKGGLK